MSELESLTLRDLREGDYFIYKFHPKQSINISNFICKCKSSEDNRVLIQDMFSMKNEKELNSISFSLEFNTKNAAKYEVLSIVECKDVEFNDGECQYEDMFAEYFV